MDRFAALLAVLAVSLMVTFAVGILTGAPVTLIAVALLIGTVAVAANEIRLDIRDNRLDW